MTINHAQGISELAEQLRPVLENSPDGVYIWLDETNKVCNQKMAELFGYTVEEWVATDPFLENFVAPEDRGDFSENYWHHVAELSRPVTFRFKAQRKDGSTFDAVTDMIPLCWQGHPVAYHFVRRA